MGEIAEWLIEQEMFGDEDDFGFGRKRNQQGKYGAIKNWLMGYQDVDTAHECQHIMKHWAEQHNFKYSKDHWEKHVAAEIQKDWKAFKKWYRQADKSVIHKKIKIII